MKRILISGLMVMVVVFASVIPHAQAKSTPENTVQSYLVISSENKLPKNIDNDIRKRGGKVKKKIHQLGITVVETRDAAFAVKAANIAGVQSVLPNLEVQWIENQQVEALEMDSQFSSADYDFHYDLQWSLQAIRAPEAWAAGHQGQGVLVAVLDTGFDTNHPDLVDNIDMELSTSLVQEEGLDYIPEDEEDMFSHGTHIAGIIAAADNGIGTIGVAPKARLMLVKVLKDNGKGEIADVLSGITYAADQKAKIINMSFGAQFDTNGFYYSAGEWLPMPKKEILEYRRLMGRAVTYANSKGALVVAATGNDGWYRGSGSSILILPADAQNAIGVSATGPIGWATQPKTSLDYLALYSNVGHNLVDVAAPGGDYRYKNANLCKLNKQEKECWVFDMVISTGYSHDPAVPAYYWTVGTSAAAAHTSGVLALLIGKNNGRISVGQATTRLVQSVDDLGPAGKDEYFGAGRVNAAKIVK
jgi:lantibiotic leader peptide-processing serine protease